MGDGGIRGQGGCDEGMRSSANRLLGLFTPLSLLQPRPPESVTGTDSQGALYLHELDCACCGPTVSEIRETAGSETDRNPALCILQTYSFHK